MSSPDLVENGTSQTQTHRNGDPRPRTLFSRLVLTFRATWDLGIFSFGGPPVHYQIFYRRFVQTDDEKMKWADDKMYHDLFALSQGLPGPASTKFMFCLTLVHLGFLPALLQFFLWSFPGALGMYLSALALARIPDKLPELVYACMSGLNAGTVGVVASSAVLLSEGVLKVRKASDGEVVDTVVGVGVTRIILVLAACASVGYEGKAIWFFPSIMIGGALIALVYGMYVDRKIQREVTRRQNGVSDDGSTAENGDGEYASATVTNGNVDAFEQRRATRRAARTRGVGIVLIVGFFLVFTTINSARAVYTHPPVLYKLFSNLFLAGTIIFGGGPVVVPLLDQYIVQEGWVSDRDFLLGLALIQAFPGPNFNFSVLLAALSPTSVPAPIASLVGFIAMFAPGMILACGCTLIWFAYHDAEKGHKDVRSTAKDTPSVRGNVHIQRVLKGVNAAAVGLVWSAVVRLWEKGYLRSSDGLITGNFTEQLQASMSYMSYSFILPARGTPLGDNPWWIVVAVVAFTGNRWYGVSPPLSILLGGCLGFLWGYTTYGGW